LSQLPLALRLEAYARFATFVAGRNGTLVQHLETLAGRPEGGLVWLWGGAACGKSHLLQAACRAAALAGRRAMYVPLGAHAANDPRVLADLEGIELLAIDEPERAAGERSWERELFLVLDAAVERAETVLMAARTAPAAVAFTLADLSSRAAAAVVYRVHSLTDDRRLEALIVHARARGLELDESAGRYLLHRVERDMRELVNWLDRLDRASLIAQRRLTIPFIRETLLGTGADS
jgi:DnaA family protein